ncbi:MAG: dihydroorotase [Nanoarchaeota archaeon]|nr:dihydroorotase [Nanoarchaeota archaeon]
MIDPHVHCRDGNQSYKETIAHVFQIADSQGVTKIFDMPNTDPPILREIDVLNRFKLVPKERKNDYYMYIGATDDETQLKEAIHCARKFKEVIGIKMFAGHSVGNLALPNISQQQKVFRVLVDERYEGVLVVHCEREDQMLPEKWTAKIPQSHSWARPKEAEIESVRDQIGLAKEAWFKGTLHIPHISCPEAVKLVDEAREFLRITCGVTPHHIMWNSKKQGLLYKMNPPLRDEDDRIKMLQLLREGKIDWIETDHAPHAIGEKLYAPYMSGFPSLYIYKEFVEEFLPRHGVKVDLLKKLTYENIAKTFHIGEFEIKVKKKKKKEKTNI